MPKQSKNKVEEPLKLKKPVSFEQRFKDKKNVVGKQGILNLLGLLQPFDLARAPTPLLTPAAVSHIDAKNPEEGVLGNYSELGMRRKHSEQIVIARKSEQPRGQSQPKLPLLLPRIGKSIPNILVNTQRRPASENAEYWDSRGENKKSYKKKRSNSMANFANLVKHDEEASNHWRNLQKFEKLSTIRRKVLGIKTNA